MVEGAIPYHSVYGAAALDDTVYVFVVGPDGAVLVYGADPDTANESVPDVTGAILDGAIAYSSWMICLWSQNGSPYVFWVKLHDGYVFEAAVRPSGDPAP